jgi:hypothetical protein
LLLREALLARPEARLEKPQTEMSEKPLATSRSGGGFSRRGAEGPAVLLSLAWSSPWEANSRVNPVVFVLFVDSTVSAESAHKRADSAMYFLQGYWPPIKLLPGFAQLSLVARRLHPHKKCISKRRGAWAPGFKQQEMDMQVEEGYEKWK